MTWQYPTWWGFVLLGLAVYRTWRFIALDSVVDRWRRPVLRRVPQKLHEGVECPFCLGFWVVLAWWLAYIAWPKWSLIVATPCALSAAVGVFAANLDPTD